MNYRQTLDYMYSMLPMFHRQGAAAYKKDLTNTLALCAYFDNPHQKFRSIHIAGTNGKGSVSHFLASILQEAGYITGLYTSPHLLDFRERIKIDGQMISEDRVIEFVEMAKPLVEKIKPSFFELTVAMAFHYFAQQKADVAVIETGLGGRLDSTNVLTPLLSVITNISYDHVNMLGNTLEEIATEKAGIIKQKTPVVVGKRHPETDDIFIRKAIECHSPIIFAEEICHFSSYRYDNGNLRVRYDYLKDNQYIICSTPLAGLYQLQNIKAVLAAVGILKGIFSISREDIKNGLQNVLKNTGLRGRWEILNQEPFIIADVAHNEDGLKNVIHQIQSMEFKQLHIVIGMVKDKDISRALAALPLDAHYYFCSPPIERGLPAKELQVQAASIGLRGTKHSSVNHALKAAKVGAGKADAILCTGSFFVIAEILKAETSP